MLALVLLAAIAADDPGFGGNASAPAPAEAASDAPAGDDACVIKGDDGVWRSCDEVIASKKKPSTTEFGPTRDEGPEARALRKQAEEAERAAQDAKAPEKTQLEIDIEKAHLDPTLPLLVVRVELARAQQVVDALEKKGTGGAEKDAAAAKLAEVQGIVDDVERIALARMDFCLQRHGKKPVLKNYRMTAAGPVLLSVTEMMAELPIVDPSGCERIILVDDNVIARVKRKHELKRILATRTFGYYEIDERRALEKELKALDTELGKEATPSLFAPGVKDPFGR